MSTVNPSVAFFNFNDITTYANAAALTAVETATLPNGMYAAVTDLGVFQLAKESSATPNGTTVIAGDKAGTTWNVNYFSHLLLNNQAEIDGSQVASFSSASFADGTVGAPAITWSSDQTDGLYRIGSHNEGYAINGTLITSWSATAFTSTVPYVAPVGAAATPAFTFAGDVDTGIYHPAANQVAIATNGALSVTVAATAVTLASGVGLTMTSARVQKAQGANVATATNVTLGSDGNFFLLTGTTTIQTIIATGWQAGSEITLMFNGSVTVTNAGTGTGATMLLAGAANMSATANDILKLVYNGTNWVEICRSVN